MTTLNDRGIVGLVDQELDVDVQIGEVATLTTFDTGFYSVAANPAGGGAFTVEITDTLGGTGGQRVILTIPDGEVFTSDTFSLPITGPVYRRITLAPPAMLNLAGYVSSPSGAGPDPGGPMPVGGNLCTLASVKLRLDRPDSPFGTDHDLLLAEIISAVSQQLQSAMRRVITLTEYPDVYYDPNNHHILVARQWPIDATWASTEIIDAGQTLANDGSQWRIDSGSTQPGRILTRVASGLPIQWSRDVKTTLRAGYAQVPLDIQGAACDQTIHNFNRSRSGGQYTLGLASKASPDGGTSSYIIDALLPHVQGVVNSWTRLF